MSDRRILTLNAGSSSLKFGLYDPDAPDAPLETGAVEGVGGPSPRMRLKTPGRTREEALDPAAAADQGAALAVALSAVREELHGATMEAVGHRVVHGGERFSAPALLDADALDYLAGYEKFAPLHQPFNLAGVRAAQAAFPGAAQVACFDTAFHRTMAPEVEAYGLPYEMYGQGIRRYGFHGLSYEAIARKLAAQAPELLAGRVIVAHLGSGASMCAMKGGRSVATTMGFSPLDGLVMSTRCGHMDPGVVFHLMENEGWSEEAVSNLLYRKSGLLGLSGESGDMRALLESGSAGAARAIDIWVHRATREIGSLAAALQGVDGIVFTAGIGERSAAIRARICAALGWLGLDLDAGANDAGAGEISAPGSACRALVIETDEEGVIARAAAALAG
ncbi:acetate/propionate family kinase [Rhodovulum sp. DZ06]|uniref:acetate/propionate family kinase n=1 Tax=Rhodovulum sp. DZ06 TaxID=3425126 RepID=UPI003D32A200